MKHTDEITDKRYLALKEKVLKIVILVGLAATSIGAVSNRVLEGRLDLSVLVHLFGFLLLLVLLLFYKRMDKALITHIALFYFCFVYTPFGWYAMSGIYDTMAYVPFVFFLLISILVDGRTYRIFTWSYYAEILLLLAHNSLYAKAAPNGESFIVTAFSYLVMLSILVFVTNLYKKQYMLFVHATNHNAITDVLTGLHNHRYLTEQIAEMEKAHRALPESDWAIAIIDLDDFKQINDHHGHTAGDAVLRELGRVLDEAFAGHTVGRYGGDEFVAIFNQTPFPRCVEVCERLLARIQGQLFTDLQITICLSIGLCSYRHIQGDNLLHEADLLLYEAKKSKNTLCYHGKPELDA